MFLYSNSTVSGGRSRHGKKLAITGCTSLRQGAVDGRHVIEALKIICSRMRLTLKAGECRYRESFVIFLIAQKLGRVSPTPCSQRKKQRLGRLFSLWTIHLTCFAICGWFWSWILIGWRLPTTV